eukprot:CAMPEP_0170244336 /NCGR_PEP_ID=MMETSP0116_2-20130129/21948_1 /TAXON_ID=400756 /ORGANISM="Durinskia baltica, Strain CSIRO CS-38" /LENGTH=165 /DNA_ID=CAMNT_0010495199 /DNA_START=48 /DNA_END=543 /DNA_ORIENTATION=-
MSKTLDLTGLDKVLDQWNWAKGEQAAMSKKIEECKTKVEAFLMKSGVTDLVTAKYKVQKRMQARESISKKDVPANIWSAYAKKSEFSVLAFTALTGKRSPAAKAKAKAKAAGKAAPKVKAKAKGKKEPRRRAPPRFPASATRTAGAAMRLRVDEILQQAAPCEKK